MKVTKESEVDDELLDSIERVISTCEGVIEGLEDGVYTYESKFKPKYDNGKRFCTYLTIKTEEGTERVEFPKQLHIIERDSLNKRTIRYKKTHTLKYDFRFAVERWDYKIEIAKGKYKDFTFKTGLGFSPPVRGGP